MAGVKGFESDSGATIVEDSPTDYAKIKAQVAADQGTWDVVDVESTWAAANCGSLLMELDEKIIDRSVLPPDNQGSACSVPVVGTGNIFAYDADEFPEAPDDWQDFFDVDQFPGKRAVFAGNPAAVLEAALMADGVASEELYPLDVDRAFAKLDTIKEDLVFWSTGAQATQMVESSQAAMGIFWSGRVLGAVENGANWEPVYDRPLVQYDELVIPKSAPNPIAAMALINYALGAEQMEIVTQETSYPGTNVNSDPKLDPLVAKYQASQAPYVDPVTVDSAWWGDNIGSLTDRWTTWING